MKYAKVSGLQNLIQLILDRIYKYRQNDPIRNFEHGTLRERNKMNEIRPKTIETDFRIHQDHCMSTKAGFSPFGTLNYAFDKHNRP